MGIQSGLFKYIHRTEYTVLENKDPQMPNFPTPRPSVGSNLAIQSHILTKHNDHVDTVFSLWLLHFALTMIRHKLSLRCQWTIPATLKHTGRDETYRFLPANFEAAATSGGAVPLPRSGSEGDWMEATEVQCEFESHS